MAVYGICCLLGDAPPVPAKWSQPNKFRSVNGTGQLLLLIACFKQVQQLCRGATSLQNVVSAAHGSPVEPPSPFDACYLDHTSRRYFPAPQCVRLLGSDLRKRFPQGKHKSSLISMINIDVDESHCDLYRLRGRPQSALWKTLFRDGKLVGVDDGKVDSNVQEKELGLQFLRDGDINQGSTANFNPYHQTLHGAQHCPHFQGIRDSGTRFHHPQVPHLKHQCLPMRVAPDDPRPCPITVPSCVSTAFAACTTTMHPPVAQAILFLTAPPAALVGTCRADLDAFATPRSHSRFLERW